MGQGTTETVKSPDDEGVTGLQVVQALSKPWSAILGTRGSVFEKVTIIDASGDKRVSLQIGRLAVIIAGNAHIADEHAENPKSLVSACYLMETHSDSDFRTLREIGPFSPGNRHSSNNARPLSALFVNFSSELKFPRGKGAPPLSENKCFTTGHIVCFLSFMYILIKTEDAP